MAILQRHKNNIYGLTAELTALNSAIGSETTRASSAEGALDSRITSEVATLNGTIDAEVSRAQAAEQALQAAINNILTNADATALNSLAEIVSAFQQADTDINGAITVLSTAALQKANNLSDLPSKSEARTNLGVYSTAEVDSLIGSGGAGGAGVGIGMSNLVVASGAITLPNAPLSGVAGVLNFGTARYTDANGVAYDAPLIATGNASVFNISTDTAGQWDGFTVQVQYLYAL